MKTKAPRRRRLLLLEFASRERWVYNSRHFPFIKGAAEKLGIPARWLCFGAELSTEKTGRAEVRQYRDLSAQDRDLLRRQVSRLRPTHIITSHGVSRAVRDCLLEAAATPPQWLSLADHPALHGELTLNDLCRLAAPPRSGRAGAASLPPLKLASVAARTDWLLNWLGESPRTCQDHGKFLVGAFRPSYDAVVGNAAFRDNKPHIIIMGGTICDHRAKLRDNPHYRGLDFSQCASDFGCGFCTYFRDMTSDAREDPLAAARAQFSRIAATAGKNGRSSGVFEVSDIRLFCRLEKFFAMISRVGLGPSTFCFEPTINRFLRSAASLERVLPSLARRGHRISLLRMGAESLVDEENELYNKHVTLAQIDETTRRLRDLAARFPATFSYDCTFGYIAASPWTTLESFETGVKRAVARRFDPKGVWLYTPLVLYPSSALAQLAQRQGGIVQAEHGDLSLAYGPAVNDGYFEQFLPWRFRDERMAAAFALIVRFCAAALRGKYPDALFRGDPLYRRLLARRRGMEFFARPDLFALEVIALVKAGKPPYEKAALLAAALERYADRPQPAGPGPSPRLARPQGGGPADEERARRLRFMLEAVLRSFPALFADIRLLGVRAAAEEAAIFAEFAVGPARCALTLTDRATTARWMFQTEHLAATCDPKTPIASAAQQRKLQNLLRLFDAALSRHAPELAPGPKSGA